LIQNLKLNNEKLLRINQIDPQTAINKVLYPASESSLVEKQSLGKKKDSIESVEGKHDISMESVKELPRI
jgi:hypothetical protein